MSRCPAQWTTDKTKFSSIIILLINYSAWLSLIVNLSSFIYFSYLTSARESLLAALTRTESTYHLQFSTPFDRSVLSRLISHSLTFSFIIDQAR
jgi:hypothetical protein